MVVRGRCVRGEVLPGEGEGGRGEGERGQVIDDTTSVRSVPVIPASIRRHSRRHAIRTAPAMRAEGRELVPAKVGRGGGGACEGLGALGHRGVLGGHGPVIAIAIELGGLRGRVGVRPARDDGELDGAGDEGRGAAAAFLGRCTAPVRRHGGHSVEAC